MIVPLLFGTLAASAAGTWLVRRYARRRGILDHPTDRGLHEVPTPRGGGLAIVASFLGGLAALWASGSIESRLVTALAPGLVAVAAIGWLDDRRGVPAGMRLLVHLAAATAAVLALQGLPSLRIGQAALDLGKLGAPLAVLALVWATNLYNFMDGIDGIAALTAVVGGTGGVLLALVTGDLPLAAVALLLAAAAAGFLPLNWQPATIFMGDVGSGALGFAFGVLALASERRGAAPALLWVLVFGVFLADATITLVRRAARGEKWHAAHRSHAYQRLVQAGWRHSRVTLAAGALTVVLAILAVRAAFNPRFAPWGYGMGALLLGIAYFGVGRQPPVQPIA